MEINKNFVLLFILHAELLWNICFRSFAVSLFLSDKFGLIVATVLHSSAKASFVPKWSVHVSRFLGPNESWYERASTSISSLIVWCINFELATVGINLWDIFFLILIENHQITLVHLVIKWVFLSQHWNDIWWTCIFKLILHFIYMSHQRIISRLPILWRWYSF